MFSTFQEAHNVRVVRAREFLPLALSPLPLAHSLPRLASNDLWGVSFKTNRSKDGQCRIAILSPVRGDRHL
jgi:hypothetical protein